MPGLTFEAEDGSVSSPFQISGGYIYQAFSTNTPSTGGKAVYSFNITEAGEYIVKAMVDAADDGSNSFFVNIDSEPISPEMIWDIVSLTDGFEQRTVSLRGSGTFDNPEYTPKVFNLSSGTHELIIRAREANTRLDRITISSFSSATCSPTNGDGNGDGKATPNDFAIWAYYFELFNPVEGGPSSGDFNCDGHTNANDFAIWAYYFSPY
jgi:hypothetical protein